ncbi:MAG TPA: acyl-CoA dehydrogenase [Spirochaetota bacterium]|nr:acyl-CoA dehydrogenase [Spirochaetota bacterium]
MASLLVEKRDIDFILYEQFDILKLTKKDKFSYFSKDEFDMTIEQALKFAENELAPINQDGDRIGAKWDNGKVTVPPSFHGPLKTYGEAGWVSAADDTEVDGQGLPMSVFTACNEMFHAANTAINLYPGLAHGAGKLIELYGTDEQKRKYLGKVYSFEWGGSMCLTESGAGSDLAHIATKAARIDDTHYKISGQKIFITGGDYDAKPNIVHPVLARREGDPEGIKGISIFIVPKYRVNDDGSIGGYNDVACAGIEHKMGIKGSATCTLSFGDNGDCIGELLGQPCQGIEVMFHMMNEERLNVGVQALGIASTAYLNALKYSQERLQGADIRLKGKSTKLLNLIKHPDIRRGLLWMKSYVEGLRALNYYAAFCMDLRNAETDEAVAKTANGFLEFLTPVCKAYSSDMGYDVCEQAIQIFGGYGFCGDYPVEQFARDCKITSLYEGTNGIQAIDLVGRKLSMAKGEFFKYIVGQMEKTINEVGADMALQKYANLTKKAKDGMVDCAQHLMGLMQQMQIPEAFVSATPFLEVVGDTILGWMHLWQLSIAHKKLGEIFEKANAVTEDEKKALINDNREAAFYSGKVHSARFFISKILPLQEAKVKSIKDDDFAALQIEEVAFSEVAVSPASV